MTAITDIKVENDYIVVLQSKIKHSKTSSGIILNEIEKWKDTLVGTVVAVSESCSYPLSVSVGDTVYFTEVGVKSKTHLDGKEYLFISEKECLGHISDR